MSTILEKIVSEKKKQLAQQKQLVPLQQLEKTKRNRAYFSLKEALLRDNSSQIIAEFKRKSPSKGWINKHADVSNTVLSYKDAGACAISVLTDSTFFGGSAMDLSDAAKNVALPILRKDFVVDAYQIIEAAQLGADVVLLIAACLSKKEVAYFSKIASNMGLEVILEIHNASQLEYLNDKVSLVGVNNRNLHEFKTTLNNSIELSEQIPAHLTKISESGIKSAQDIQLLKQHHYAGFLVGEQFMKQEQPGLACKTLIQELNHA